MVVGGGGGEHGAEVVAADPAVNMMKYKLCKVRSMHPFKKDRVWGWGGKSAAAEGSQQ